MPDRIDSIFHHDLTMTTAKPSSRVRVLLVGPSLNILGGQAVQARRLLDGLTNSKRVEVSFLAVNPQLPGIFGYLQRIKYVRTIVTTIAYLSSLLRRVPHVDVVHAYSASYYSYLLAPLPALLVAKLFGRRSLLNYRSGEAPDHLARWPLSRRTIATIPDRIVVPSGYLVEVFRRFNITAHSIVNFVPIERLPYRQRTGFSPKLLSNRNLESLYNVGCVLHAFALIQQVHPEAELLIAGDGAQRRELESLTHTLSLRNVNFLGKVPSERMGELYDRCDLYVNTPNIDNMPASIIEAFACGLPVVTTNAGGIPFIVEHERNGLMVECNDAHALAASVLRLLEDQALARRLADAAREECVTRYVWPRVQAEWENCYEHLAARMHV